MGGRFRQGKFRARRRWAESPWVYVVSLFLAASIALGLGAVFKDLGGPLKAAAVVLSGGGLVALALSLARRPATSHDTRAEALEKYAQKRPQRFKDVGDIDLGIHPPVQDAPEFLERDKTEEVCRLLEAGQPVLIVGNSMAGKSRLAAEAVRRTYPRRRTLIASSGKGLAELLDRVQPTNSVIWLDDLENFVPDGLTRERVRNLQADGNILIATIRYLEKEKFAVTASSKPSGWDVFGCFSEVPLDDQLSDSEMHKLSQSSYATLKERVETYGLGAYLGGGTLAWKRYEASKNSQPLAWASIRAAADWYLITLEPIPNRTLKEVAPSYLPPGRNPEAYAYDKAVDWASERINESVCLLIPAPNGTWSVFDFVQDRLTGDGNLIRQEILDFMLTEAKSGQLSKIHAYGAALYACRLGRLELAENICDSALESRQPIADCLLLDTLRSLTVLRACEDESRKEIRGLVNFRLRKDIFVPEFLRIYDDLCRAETYSQDPLQFGLFQLYKWVALAGAEKRGSDDAQRHLYDAITCGDPDIELGAAHEYVLIRMQPGVEPVPAGEAEAYLRKQLGTQYSENSAQAAVMWAVMLYYRDEKDHAKELFERARSSECPEAARQAAKLLNDKFPDGRSR
jgi:hypothetical protein